jgi:LPS O-antigen subunit length determinant protein (WzzB/FepE family)
MNVVPNEPLSEEPIDLRVWVRTLWGHRWILAVSVLAGGIAGWAVSASTTSARWGPERASLPRL